jgi:multicomponent Na+:H+ antiporter subunit D
LIFVVGGLLVPLLRGKVRSAFMLLLPVVAFYFLLQMPDGKSWIVPLLDYDLVLARVDKLSLVFGYIFTLITFIGVLYALKEKDGLQHLSSFVYAGGALGVTFAGDFFTLYIFWEIMAVASTFLILARRTRAAQAAAFRYILVHIVGGLSLLAGIVLYAQQQGTLEFSYIGLEGAAAWFIFIGIALNAAIPPLHAWLQDAYPEATVTGAVFLSALTTKSAVYVMARTFPGTELLIWLGALMTAIPIFYAVLENDIRRVLAYSLINQVGFMMCGVGIGTELAINGTVSHAFCHILYKALLFMSAGAVLYRTGKIRCTDLGGLYKTMPITCVFCMIGAASISAFPLFSGFVSKSMIVSAAGHGKLIPIWLMLQFASAGVFHHAGIKVPFFTFFGHDSGLRPKEAPLNMLLAMGIAAFFCIFLAIFPGYLYDILPYPVDYVPYTGAHVVGQLQLLMFGALAFTLLILSGHYPAEMRAQNLDTDWFYRKGTRAFYFIIDRGLNALNRATDWIMMQALPGRLAEFSRDGMAYLGLLVLEPFWAAAGISTEGRSARRKAFIQRMEKGLLPIGLIALSVLICLGIFSFFSEWL